MRNFIKVEFGDAISEKSARLRLVIFTALV
jgi:hypothetical protein